MSHGTTVYFQHGDEALWRSQLLDFEKILEAFGASTEAWEFYKPGDLRYKVVLAKGYESSLSEAKIVDVNEFTLRVECPSIDLLADEAVSQVEVDLGRYGKRAVCSGRRGKAGSGSLGIFLIYRPSAYSGRGSEGNQSRGVWRLDLEIPLDPVLAKGDLDDGSYSYEEIWAYYDLMKRIHCEMGFDLTAGSFVENYYQFGDSEGRFPGFDSLFRFERTGTSRLIWPYEEKRPFKEACDENGNTELSVDPQTGLYRCVVQGGPVTA